MKELSDWLQYIKSIHHSEIEMGLERVREVAIRLNLMKPATFVITVGGTNGKGSTVAGLEAVYLAAQYRVGSFTTPFLLKHNEQVRIQGRMVQDQDLITAFEQVEAARGKISLTQFEFNTLAALVIFVQAQLDVCLLEVGLGGRLDAVNIIDADLTIITSIDLDHTDRLGTTRELIAIEKAGIFRHAVPVVCGEPQPPQTLLDCAASLSAPFYQQNKDFHFSVDNDHWDWWTSSIQLIDLPLTALLTQNLSNVLMAIYLLQPNLPTDEVAIRQGLAAVTLPGRIQVLQKKCRVIVDVAHNPAAVKVLANYLANHACLGKTYAVFSMLGDKDIHNSAAAIKNYIDEWHIAEINAPRACPILQLQQHLQALGIKNIESYPDLTDAYEHLTDIVNPEDQIIIFGSFYTISYLTDAMK